MSSTLFSRILLKEVMKDVRRHVPSAERKTAWVWTSDRRTWEFHFNKFYRCFRASDAYEARANGWLEWLAANNKETTI